jgi:hypothetical protein
MTTWLFTNTAVKSFLSEKINQDPLEKFFGVQLRGEESMRTQM